MTVGVSILQLEYIFFSKKARLGYFQRLGYCPVLGSQAWITSIKSRRRFFDVHIYAFAQTLYCILVILHGRTSCATRTVVSNESAQWWILVHSVSRITFARTCSISHSLLSILLCVIQNSTFGSSNWSPCCALTKGITQYLHSTAIPEYISWSFLSCRIILHGL